MRSQYKKKLKQSQKGVQGFVAIPANERKRNLTTFKMTDALNDTLIRYCKDNGLSKSEVIQNALRVFFDSKGTPIQESESIDPSQLSFDV